MVAKCALSCDPVLVYKPIIPVCIHHLEYQLAHNLHTLLIDLILPVSTVKSKS